MMFFSTSSREKSLSAFLSKSSCLWRYFSWKLITVPIQFSSFHPLVSDKEGVAMLTPFAMEKLSVRYYRTKIKTLLLKGNKAEPFYTFSNQSNSSSVNSILAPSLHESNSASFCGPMMAHVGKGWLST